MKNWRTINRRTILDTGKFLKVEYHHVEFVDGPTIPEWPWVITPDYVAVVVRRKQGDFLILHQHKYAIEGDSLSIVGGYIESGETPLAAAKRELLEQTGHEAPDWVNLGSYAVDANRGCGNGHFFLANDAHPVQDSDADDLETYDVLTLSLDELIDASRSSRFKAMSWAAAVALAVLHLDIEAP